MDVKIDANSLKQVRAELNKLPRKAELAQSRAIRRTLSWAQTQINRGIAKDTKIPVRQLRDYGRSKLKINRASGGKSASGSLFVGLNPLPADLLRNPKQEDWGVMAGGYLFEGAFYGAVFGAKKSILFRRYRSRGAQKNIAYKKLNARSGSNADSVGRFPLDRAGVVIEPAGRKVEKQVQPDIKPRFERNFISDMQFRLGQR